jgi:hypothetical protein
MNLFDQYYRALMEQFNSQDDEEICRSTTRTDRLGNKVSIPHGGTYKAGRNGRGVGVPRGSTSKEDAVGQLHILAPGQELKIGKDGKGQVTCQGKPPKKQPERKSVRKFSDLA